MSERNIYELIARSTNGQLNEEEKMFLREWRNASAENEAEFRELEQILFATVIIPDPEIADTDNEWAKLSAKLNKNSGSPEPVVIPFRMKLMRYAAVAASVIVLITVGWYLAQPGGGAKENSYFAAEGQQKQLKLSDGSDIVLYSGSQLTTDKAFGQENRNLKLKGEADFKVARDEKKPFIIDAGKSTVTVLGTEFNVKAREENKPVTVSVNSGKVKFEAKESKESVVLTKGESAVFDPATGKVTKKITIAVNEETGAKELQINDVPFGIAEKQIEDFYQVDIQYDDPGLINENVHQTFKEDIEGSMKTFGELLSLKAEINGKIVTLKK